MKFIQTLKDIFAIEELRTRILNTIGFLLVFRLGSFILLPGLSYKAVSAAQATSSSGLDKIAETLLGSAYMEKSLFSLGIMPYISASIVVQLLGIAIPYFQKLQRDGESGRNKINQITRFLTIAICFVQAFVFNQGVIKDNLIAPGFSEVNYHIFSTLLLISGSMFCVWLGEKITEKGIGNGISLLIMVGIISRFIPSLYGEFNQQWSDNNLLALVVEIVVWVGIVMLIIMIVQAVRQVPLSYAKQMMNSKGTDGQRSYLPLKVNAAGVMPIIFAQALMVVPGYLFNPESNIQIIKTLGAAFNNPVSWTYSITMATLILVFTYFYTAIMIHPNQIADDLKRNGGFIPGVKPGQETADYIDLILSKITLPGALFIAMIAIMPSLASAANVKDFAPFFGGTSLLILVGVVLDTVQQIDSFLIMKKYDGLMKSGRVRGRNTMAIAE